MNRADGAIYLEGVQPSRQHALLQVCIVHGQMDNLPVNDELMPSAAHLQNLVRCKYQTWNTLNLHTRIKMMTGPEIMSEIFPR